MARSRKPPAEEQQPTFAVLGTRAIAEAWRPRVRMSVSEWADEHRTLDRKESPHRPGRWSTDLVPYLRKPMDAFSQEVVERITLQCATRMGKTELLKNCYCYTVDQWPRNVLLVQPTKQLAEEFSRDHMQPLFSSCPRLEGARIRSESGRGAALTTYSYRLQDMNTWIAWATSASTLSMRTVGVVLLDELRGFPKSSGSEGDPSALVSERTETFGAGEYKIVAVSSGGVEGDALHRAWLAGDRERYHVPCPLCGAYQPLEFSRIKLPEHERDPSRIRDGRLAWYECPHCRGRVGDHHRPEMYAHGIWVPEGGRVETITRGEASPKAVMTGAPEFSANMSFRLSRLYSPWPRHTWSAIIARFFETNPSHGGSLRAFRVFVNTWLADEWVEKTEEITPDEFAEHIVDYPEGLVPSWARVLTAGVDVQGDTDDLWLQYVIRAWGPGWKSALIRRRKVTSYEELERDLIATAYPRAGSDQGGRPHPPLRVRWACMDARHRTAEVKRFCARFRDVIRPVMGHERLSGGVTYAPARSEINPRTRKRVKGSSVWMIDTTAYKDTLSRLLSSAESDDGCFWIYEGIDPEYVEQMTSERKVWEVNKRTGVGSWVWRLKREGTRNEDLDCEVYALAAADMAGVGTMTADSGPAVFKPRARRVISRGVQL